MVEFTEHKSPTPEEKRAMATKAGIDSGVIDLYQAFVTIYAMQNQINALISEVGELKERLDNWYSSGHS